MDINKRYAGVLKDLAKQHLNFCVYLSDPKDENIPNVFDSVMSPLIENSLNVIWFQKDIDNSLFDLYKNDALKYRNRFIFKRPIECDLENLFYSPKDIYRDTVVIELEPDILQEISAFSSVYNPIVLENKNTLLGKPAGNFLAKQIEKSNSIFFAFPATYGESDSIIILANQASIGRAVDIAFPKCKLTKNYILEANEYSESL